jgi:electron transfer flavoprotein alpha subunit
VILAVTWDAGGVGRPAQELLGGAATLSAGLGADVAIAALGRNAAETAAAAGAYGAARAYAFDSPVEGGTAVTALAELAGETGARAILLVADERGSEVGPRLAQRLGGTAVTSVTALSTDGSTPVWTRPVFGGKALSSVRATKEPVVATLRRGALEPAATSNGAAVNVEARTAPAVDDGVVLLEVAPPATGPALDQASVIVSGGRGLGVGEAFAELEELAGVLGGAVGASLAAVDAGWAPTDRQVGLTGKAVSPDLYFAIGISGASQHLAGIGGAKAVIAVNTDPEAPIFGRARLGVVMDCRKLVPALIDEVRRRTSQQ